MPNGISLISSELRLTSLNARCSSGGGLSVIGALQPNKEIHRVILRKPFTISGILSVADHNSSL